MLVHAMGNSPHMEQLMRLATKHRLVVIEDTCESLGSRHGGHLLGTQGHFGAYSFYYSHHITSGEGGAVVSIRRASPGPWWSTEKAFWTRSSRLLAKAEALGSIGYKSTVDVDDGSTGGSRLEAVSRPRTAGCSETSDRASQS